MARSPCPTCGKFTSLELGDAEVQDIDVDEDGHVDCEVRVTRVCTDCGEEMKEGTLQLNDDVPEETVAEHQGEGHVLSAKDKTAKASESGAGKNLRYDIEVAYEISCSCQSGPDQSFYAGGMEGEIYPAEMDDV
jgi:hypothetical protein